MFKVNYRNFRTREICSNLTVKTLERRQWRRSGVFIVNFEHVSQLVLVFLLVTLSRYMPAGKKLSTHFVPLISFYALSSAESREREQGLEIG